MGSRAYFEKLRTSRDREFEKSGVNLLSYIEKKNQDHSFTLRDRGLEEKSEFEPLSVACTYYIGTCKLFLINVQLINFFVSSALRYTTSDGESKESAARLTNHLVNIK